MIELLLVPICFFIDQYYKNKAEQTLPKTYDKTCLNNKVNLRVVYNEGAFLGLLKKHPKLLVFVNIVCICFLVVFVCTKMISKGYHITKIGVALMLAGGASNIFDRMTKKKVVDYFSFSVLPNVYFNIADFFVFIGAVFTMLGSYK